MKKSIFTLLLSLFAISVVSLAQSSTIAESDAILGVCTNSEKDAKFEIYKKGNQFFGKIISGNGSGAKDSKNPNPKLRNKDLTGLTILNNFVYDQKKTWEDGTIYDPNNGKTYSCILKLTSGDKLSVRGYVGVSLFGRTETWTRIN